jgi:sulfate transport system permease protein
VHAFEVTLSVALWAVVANTVFGIGTALLLVRHRFPGKRILGALIDLPLAVSPVVVGLALILVYGRFEPIGGWLERHGLQVIFSLPGMVLATIFVSLPLVVRAIVPVLQEMGADQEQAAHTLGAGRWQTFRRITLPGIRWALAYGVVLCLARALGEFGAVAVVSGRLVGQTQTLTLFVQERFENFDQTAAFAAATALALIAVLTLLLAKLLRPKDSD